MKGRALKEKASALANSLPFLLVVIVSLCAHWWLLTEGTWGILGGAFKGDAFDDLALNFIRFGRPSVECSILTNEALQVGDVCYMYFAPWPAMLRMPVLLILPDWQGVLSRPSCIIAASLGVLALTVIFYRYHRTAPFFSAALLLGASLGSPVFFLSNSTNLFHESIIWAQAATFWCLAGCLATLNREASSGRWFLVAALACALAILSRVTLGVASLGAVTLVGIYAFHTRILPLRTLAGASLPILGSLAITTLYNYARFGSAFNGVGGTGGEIDLANRLGLFQPYRVAEHLKFYFEPTSEHFTDRYPFIMMSIRSYGNPEQFHWWREPVLPISLASPWLVVSFVLGLCALVQSRRWIILLVTCFLIASWLPMLMHLFSTQRYTAELMPAMIFALASTLGDTCSIIYHRASIICLSLLVLLSLFITFFTMSCWTAYWVGTMWFSQTFRDLVKTFIPVCSPLA